MRELGYKQVRRVSAVLRCAFFAKQGADSGRRCLQELNRGLNLFTNFASEAFASPLLLHAEASTLP